MKSNYSEFISYELDAKIYDPKKLHHSVISLLKEFVNIIFKIRFNSDNKEKSINASYIEVNKVNVYSSLWSFKNNNKILFDLKLFICFVKISAILKFANYYTIKSGNYDHYFKSWFTLLSNYLITNNFKRIILSHDLTFFEKSIIHVSKINNITTSVYLHGIPARYNEIDDQRADELYVWGDAIRSNYLKVKKNKCRIKVVGHPIFSKNFDNSFPVINNYDRILILTKSINKIPHSFLFRNINKSAPIEYLENIKYVVSKFTERVDLKLHPSESDSFYKGYIDQSFFNFVKVIEFSKYDLIIGPSSTVLIESMINKIPYIVFEPTENNKDSHSNKIVSPFNGEDSRVPVCKTTIELEKLLNKNSFKIDKSFLEDYLSNSFLDI